MRLATSLVDQAVSSGTNFLLLILVVRQASTEGVGAFALAYGAFFLLLAVSRGLAGDPLAISYADAAPEPMRQAIAQATGATFLVGCFSAGACVVVGLSLTGALQTAFVCLAAGLPFLLLQDAWRLSSFAMGVPMKALINDVVFLIVQVATYVGLQLSGHLNMPGLILGWSFAGSVAAGVGIAQFRARPYCSGAIRWWTLNRRLALPLMADYLANRAAEQLTLVALTTLGTLAAQGAISATRTLFAPLTTIQMGVQAFALPVIARAHLSGSGSRVRHLTLALVVAMAALMATGGFALYVLPDSWGVAAFHENWHAMTELILPMTAFSVVNAVAFALWVGLRASGQATATMVMRAAFGALMVVGAAVAVGHGPAAGIWGMTVPTLGLVFALSLLMAKSPTSTPVPHPTAHRD